MIGKILSYISTGLTIAAVVASSIWVIASAINTANDALAQSAEARIIAMEAMKKVEGIDVIEERINTLKKEIDEIQQHQVATKGKLDSQDNKLDKILEAVEK